MSKQTVSGHRRSRSGEKRGERINYGHVWISVSRVAAAGGIASSCILIEISSILEKCLALVKSVYVQVQPSSVICYGVALVKEEAPSIDSASVSDTIFFLEVNLLSHHDVYLVKGVIFVPLILSTLSKLWNILFSHHHPARGRWME